MTRLAIAAVLASLAMPAAAQIGVPAGLHDQSVTQLRTCGNHNPRACEIFRRLHEESREDED